MSAVEESVAQRGRTINLNAGPSPLPLDALLEASAALVSYPGTPGMGIAEISHRSGAFSQVMAAANADVRTVLSVPANYKVLWMQGGGLTQFSATVLNLLAWYRLKHQCAPTDAVSAEYVVTGSWSIKAAEEGARMGAQAKMIADGRIEGHGKFTGVPMLSEWDTSASRPAAPASGRPAFVYYCDNETVDGVEFPATTTEHGQAFPFDAFDPSIPIVCDMSSNFLSRPVDVAKYGVIYAGAQKNLGPAGVSIIIIRDDLLGTSLTAALAGFADLRPLTVDTDLAVEFGGPLVPAMLSYKNMADSGSMYK